MSALDTEIAAIIMTALTTCGRPWIFARCNMIIKPPGYGRVVGLSNNQVISIGSFADTFKPRANIAPT